MILTDRLPDVGMLKERHPISGEAKWIVQVGMHGLTVEDARKHAAEVLNAAEEVERLEREGR